MTLDDLIACIILRQAGLWLNLQTVFIIAGDAEHVTDSAHKAPRLHLVRWVFAVVAQVVSAAILLQGCYFASVCKCGDGLLHSHRNGKGATVATFRHRLVGWNNRHVHEKVLIDYFRAFLL